MRQACLRNWPQEVNEFTTFGPLLQPSAVAEVKVYVFVLVCTCGQALRCNISSDALLFWEGKRGLEDRVVHHLPSILPLHPNSEGPFSPGEGTGPSQAGSIRTT